MMPDFPSTHAMNDRAPDSMSLAARGFLLTLIVCLHAAGAVALSRLPRSAWHGEAPVILRASWIESPSPLLPSPPLSPPPSVEPVGLRPPVPPPRALARPAPRQRARPAVSAAAVPAVADAAPDVPVDVSGDSTPTLPPSLHADISPAAAAATVNETAKGESNGRGEEGGWGKDYVGPDFNASYLSNPEPVYPSLSRRQREQGLVKLRVHVTEEGRAGEVTLHMSSGYERLDKAALDAVKHWRFRPAQRAGTPVSGWVVVPVRFELQG